MVSGASTRLARLFRLGHRLGALGLLGALLSGPVLAAEDLLPSMREEVLMLRKPGLLGGVDLETTLFRPPGDGPFPLVVINHGKAPGDPRLQARARYLAASRELVARGYAVAVPNRQGFSHSGGAYVGAGCNVESNGLTQAEDVIAVLDGLSRRADLDTRRVVVIGQSHGGLTTLALGAKAPPNVVGLINFAGGLRQETCIAWEHNLAEAVASYARRTRLPSLWFYGENDSYFPPPVSGPMFAGYQAAGGHARLVSFGVFGRDSHELFGSGGGVRVWLPEVERFFGELGLPFAVRHRIALAEHASPPPPATAFAPLDAVDRVPGLSEAGRNGYAQFLAGAMPRAYAISGDGHWAWQSGVADAMAQALARCNTTSHKAGHADCRLYAVDESVVWSAGAVVASPSATPLAAPALPAASASATAHP